MNRRFARLVSLLLPALSTAAYHQAVGVVRPAVAYEVVKAESCLLAADYRRITFVELSDVIRRAVDEIGRGLPADRIVTLIGKEIGQASRDCSPSQLRALLRNVAVILEDLGIDAGGKNVEYLIAAVGPMKRFVVASDDGFHLRPSHTVY